MKRILAWLVPLLMLFAPAWAQGQDDVRIALVIGNSQYASDRIPDLKNPVNDAEDIARAKGLGVGIYRTSVEWSRVKPSRGRDDPAGWAFYNRVIRAVVDAGIPVMAHIGFTPQSEHTLGGYRVQGRGEAAGKLLEDARAVQDAGAFAVVLEMVPAELATQITGKLTIPTIGIGAGPNCDAQVLVWQDMAGLRPGRSPRRRTTGARTANSACCGATSGWRWR